MQQGRRTIHGFTVVELAATILVISIVGAAVITPLVYDAGRLKLDAEAKRMLTDVRYVQSLSMFRNARYRLDLSNASSYRILTSSGGTFNYMAAGGTTINLQANTTLSFSSGDKYLVFSGLGVPAVSSSSSGSGSAIGSAVTITLTKNGISETVTVQPITGLASST